MSEGGLNGTEVYPAMNNADPSATRLDDNFSRIKREVYAESPANSYQDTDRIIETRRILVVPAPGKPPYGEPQVETPGGGHLPSTDPYIAAMAPKDTEPIAIFWPDDFKDEEVKKPPRKCVIFSELTDFEVEQRREETEKAVAPQVPLNQPSTINFETFVFPFSYTALLYLYSPHRWHC